MKTYGLIVADNGSNWSFGGTTDRRWTDTMVDQLGQIPASAFQAVDGSCLMASPSPARAAAGDAGARPRVRAPNHPALTPPARIRGGRLIVVGLGRPELHPRRVGEQALAGAEHDRVRRPVSSARLEPIGAPIAALISGAKPNPAAVTPRPRRRSRRGSARPR